MTVFFEQNQIDQWINEDASFLDLTSHMLGLTEQAATLRFVTRDHITVAGTEEVVRLVQSCGGHTRLHVHSGAQAGADVVQFDKVTPEQLARIVPELRAVYPDIPLLAAGGIHGGNAAAYAASGVNALVTSSLHHAKPADIGVKIELEDGHGKVFLPATGTEGAC